VGTRGVSGRVYVLVELDEVETDEGVGASPKRLQHRMEYSRTFTSGTTDTTQLDRIWSTSTAQTTTETDLDVRGSIAGILDSGDTVVVADMAIMCLINDDPTGGDDLLLGAGANPFTGMLTAGSVASIKPGGLLLWVAPDGVPAVAATSDIIRLDSTGTATARALLAGRSA